MSSVTFLALIVFVLSCNSVEVSSLKLKQVLILSRHNVRAPLASNLDRFSSKPWPKFDVEVAHLTEKGLKLESEMAEYFSSWLAEEKLIEGCPINEEILIYANTKPRTVDTAKTFTKFAFKNCNVPVNFKQNTTLMDPLFNPIFHNTEKSFLNDAFNETQYKLKELDLREAYSELNRVLNLKDSDSCKDNAVCDFTNINSNIVYIEGEEPNVQGPLFYGNAIVDYFIMSYYEGKPIEEVAWGEITSHDQWKLLTKIIREDQNVRFNLTSVSKDIARPLLKYMFNVLKNETTKFTLLVGHDSNLNLVINALGFKWFELPDQYEPFPIGGKLVFQRWTDDSNDYLKVEYVYQGFSDLRDGKSVSVANPPHKVVLELKNCSIDDKGFCPWVDFMNLYFN